MKAENYSHSTQSVSDLFIEAKIIIIIFSFYLSVTSDKRLSLAECRDGNSSEISLLEESQDGNLPFLGEFRGLGCYFILLIYQDLLVLLVLILGIITKNINLWDKNSIMIKNSNF